MSMIRRLKILVALGMVVLALGGCASGPRLQGTVLDASTGLVIEQAQVQIGEDVVVTDAKGRYHFDLEPGDHVARVQAPGYVALSAPVTLSEKERTSLDLELAPRLLEGRVVAADTGEPVAVLLQFGDESVATGADGTFSFPAREVHALSASAEGCVANTISADAIAAAFSDDGRLLEPLELSVAPRVLQGVVQEPDGTLVQEAEVRVGKVATRSDSQGQYMLRFVEEGQPLAVASTGHHPLPESVYQGQSEYTITLEPYIATLNVVEEGSERPVADVAVSLGDEQLASTDSEGLARVRVAPDSTLTLAAHGYLTTTVLYAGDSSPIAAALLPTLLQGVIRNTSDQTGIANALVQVFRGDGPPELLRTDEQGQYQIPDATDVTRLFIKAPGFDRAEAPVSQLGTLDFDLEPFAAQGIYIPFGLLSLPDRIYELLDFVEASPSLNAVVIDAKGDWARIAWPSEVPVAKEIGAYSPGPMDMDEVLAAAKERGIYTIARIVTFKDILLGERKPEWVIHTQSGQVYLDGENLPWGDPFRTEVWDYNIDVALEAIAKGFDEVQFDYMRFPSEGSVSDRVYSEEATFESRTAAIRGFCAAAYAAIEPTPAFVSADIFGLTVWVDPSRDMGIGQRVEDVAPYMDYISPMLYPQTFNPANLQFLGISDVELYPYETLYYSIRKTLSRTGTVVRPWLQHYSGRYTYGLTELLEQRKGAEDGGATGWLFWNAKGSYIEELFGPDPYSHMAVVPQPPVDEEEE